MKTNLENLLKQTIERRINGADRSESTLQWLSGNIVALEQIKAGKINKDNLQAEIEKAKSMRMASELRTGEPDNWVRGYLLTLEHFDELEF